MTVNYELKEMWKKTAISSIKVEIQHFSGVTDETPNVLSCGSNSLSRF
jgi:hypothetical protein